MLDRKNFLTEAAFQRARFDAIHSGKFELPWLFRPVRVKILMVVDGYPGAFLNISFGQSYFGLSAVLDTLANTADPWVRFDVTKAHRQTDPLGEADMEGFRFTQAGFDINQYDQVWFFGARNNEGDVDRLTDQELAIVARWMDEKKGGVFATGDHADLGASLCARIPRVRSMRKWTPAQGVPQPNGVNRHDTLLPGHDTSYTFDDESDDIPMPIEVTMFPVRSWHAFQLRSAPHPVLCGKKGIVDILPDHPHEGEAIVPSSYTQTFSFPGYTNKPEYPEKIAAPGQREPAHIIAKARVRARTTAQDPNKGQVNGKTFGAIGAYNGHASNVGRVVVDSTWHHWFDVNLIGRPGLPASNPKSQGFLASPAGETAYAEIQNYFRNVALWLNSPAKQDALFFRATWRIFQLYPLVEQLSPKLPLWELGGYALDAIGREAGQCTVRTWIIDRFERLLPEKFRIPPFDDVCLTCPPIDAFETIVMGGVVRNLLEVSEGVLPKNGIVKEEIVAKAFESGLREGVDSFAVMLDRSIDNVASLAKSLKRKDAVNLTAEQFLEATKKQETGEKTRTAKKAKKR
jgi:hypothetical protein